MKFQTLNSVGAIGRLGFMRALKDREQGVFRFTATVAVAGRMLHVSALPLDVAVRACVRDFVDRVTRRRCC